MKRLNNKGSACIFAILVIAFGSWFGWAIHNVESNSSPTQAVSFVNTRPGTILGLVKFVVDKKGEPIDYEVLHERWTDEKKILQLEPGYYGVTQYEEFIDPVTGRKLGAIVDYQNFWVEYDPVLITM